MAPSSPSVLAIIPSRFGSSRLPGKPLLPMLGGAPMIAHVVRAALAARSVNRVLVATDHEQIAAAAEHAGATAVMTDSEIATGTDRVAEALRLTQATADVVVNVQGDEPLIEPHSIDLAARLLLARPSADVATLSAPLPHSALLDPSKVKVVCSPAGESRDGGAFDDAGLPLGPSSDALFFSRAPIGVDRDSLHSLLWPQPDAEATPKDVRPGSVSHACRLHVGLYAFRPASLQRFVALPPSRLEELEHLEQMRALENGMRIVVGEVDHASRGVDTHEDVRRLEELWQVDRGLRESLRTWLAANGYSDSASR